MKFLVTFLVEEYDENDNVSKYYQETLVDLSQPNFYQAFKTELRLKNSKNKCILFNCNTVGVYNDLPEVTKIYIDGIQPKQETSVIITELPDNFKYMDGVI